MTITSTNVPDGLKRVVVTGAAGFIGSHLAQALLRSGVRVTGIDSRAVGNEIAAGNLGDCLSHRGFRFIKEDLRKTDLHHELAGCDTVFHLAALPGVRTSWGNQFNDYLAVNVGATNRVLEACGQAAVPRLVMASSSSVYGDHGAAPSSELDRTTPRSPYGVTKLAAEQLALAHALRGGFPTTVIALRYFSVFGPRQRPDMLISRALRAALFGQAVTIYGDGTQRRDFTYVEDVVAATITASRAPGTAEVVNVGTGKTRSILDVLRIAEQLSGRSLNVVQRPPAAGDVDATWANVTKARTLLSLETTVSLEDGMSQQWEWMIGSTAKNLSAEARIDKADATSVTL